MHQIVVMYYCLLLSQQIYFIIFQFYFAALNFLLRIATVADAAFPLFPPHRCTLPIPSILDTEIANCHHHYCFRPHCRRSPLEFVNVGQW